MQQMTAAFLVGPKNIEIRQVPIPAPDEDRILVHMMAVRVCGSDVHYYEHGRMGPFEPTEPLVLGHESAGVIVSCGSRVRGFSVGDRVLWSLAFPVASVK